MSVEITPPPGYRKTSMRWLWAQVGCADCGGAGEYLVNDRDDRDEPPEPDEEPLLYPDARATLARLGAGQSALSATLDAAEGEEDPAIRAAARRTGTLWQCPCCGDDNPCQSATCDGCGFPRTAAETQRA